jgi:hypothetical protein
MVTQTSDTKISIGWPPRSFSILNWREINNFIDFYFSRTDHNPSSSVPYDQMTNGNNYEKNLALKLFGSHTTHIVISIQLQIKYMTNKSALWNIPLIDSNTHEYAMVQIVN